MNIRLITNNDTDYVVNIMLEHPIQFPKFVIEKYPSRWMDFFKREDDKTGFYVAYEEDKRITGHAGYIYNHEVNLFEILGVAVKRGLQRQGIGHNLGFEMVARDKDFFKEGYSCVFNKITGRLGEAVRMIVIK